MHRHLSPARITTAKTAEGGQRAAAGLAALGGFGALARLQGGPVRPGGDVQHG